MATNEILPFGAAATNEVTQAEYAADTQRANGHQPGFARSELMNKTLHQTSTIAAGVAQFIADRQGTNVVDSLLPSQVSSMLAAALGNGSALGNPGNIALPGGWIVKVGTVDYPDIAADGTVTILHPVAFPTTSIVVQLTVLSSQLVTVRLRTHDRFGATATVHEFDTTAASGTVHYVAIGY